MEHKESLYADDLTLYLSDPLTSIPAHLWVLNHFSTVSGFQINMSKSELFPLHLPLNKGVCFKQNFPYKWVKEARRHLGVQIPLKI